MMISLVIGCFEFSIFAGLAKGNPYIEVVSKRIYLQPFNELTIQPLNDFFYRSLRRIL